MARTFAQLDKALDKMEAEMRQDIDLMIQCMKLRSHYIKKRCLYMDMLSRIHSESPASESSRVRNIENDYQMITMNVRKYEEMIKMLRHKQYELVFEWEDDFSSESERFYKSDLGYQGLDPNPYSATTRAYWRNKEESVVGFHKMRGYDYVMIDKRFTESPAIPISSLPKKGSGINTGEGEE